MHMRIVCILLPPKKSRSQLTTKRHQWLVETFHRIRKVDCLELEGCKNPLWMKEIESKYTWDLGILKVFSCFFHLTLAQFLLATMKNTQLPSPVFSNYLAGISVLSCYCYLKVQGCPYFKGLYRIQWFHQPFQTTSNHLNIQFQPLKTSQTNRLAQSNLLKYTGDWWLFWNQFWDTASIISFNSIRSHLKGFNLCILF